VCAHALTEIGKSSASSGHTDRKLAFQWVGTWVEKEKKRQSGREKEKE